MTPLLAVSQNKIDLIDLSIIIPCFNHGEFLLEALKSVEDALDKNCEVIIINDGSTDPETQAILSSLKDKGYLVITQENQGLSRSRNRGIEVASGRYILPLDADNKIRPGYIQKGIAILDKYAEIGVVYSDVEFFGERIGRWSLPDFDINKLMLANFIDACAVFRKAVWQDCGGYDDQMPDKLGYEDWEFWLNVAKRGWQFYHIPEVLYDYRVRSDSMVQACKLPLNQKRLVRYICHKHYDLYVKNLADVIAEKEFAAFKQMAEADDLRSQLHQAQLELEKSRDRNNAIAPELTQMKSIVGLQAQTIRKLEFENEQLQNTIQWMQTSKLWKLRAAWTRTKQLIGLKTER